MTLVFSTSTQFWQKLAKYSIWDTPLKKIGNFKVAFLDKKMRFSNNDHFSNFSRICSFRTKKSTFDTLCSRCTSIFQVLLSRALLRHTTATVRRRTFQAFEYFKYFESFETFELFEHFCKMKGGIRHFFSDLWCVCTYIGSSYYSVISMSLDFENSQTLC